MAESVPEDARGAVVVARVGEARHVQQVRPAIGQPVQVLQYVSILYFHLEGKLGLEDVATFGVMESLKRRS